MIPLSKSKFISFLQCDKKTWLSRHHPEWASEGTESIFQIQGNLVHEAARQRFPMGRMMPDDFEQAVVATREALLHPESILFEAAFQTQDGRLRARTDILIKKDNALTVIEVKSGLRPNDLHYIDLAFQLFIIENEGYPVDKAELMMINPECRFPHLDNMFIRTDISKDARTRYDLIDHYANHINSVLSSASMPDISIGTHCKNPYECHFIDHCWASIPKASIFTIPRLSQHIREGFIERGIFDIHGLDDLSLFSPLQKEYIHAVIHNQSLIKTESIRKKLDQLKWPLYFLDFEADNPVIPRFTGMAPYQQFPFQFSLHIRQEPGQLTHVDYLHEDDSDPRLPLILRLTEYIGPVGTLIVYNKSFEKKILHELGLSFPDYRLEMDGMIDRLWDLHDIFKQDYLNPDFLGKTSIKSVLPVLVPDMTYATLDVANGMAAQLAWWQLLHESDVEKKQVLSNQLRAYCHQDTLAMVKLLEVLKNQIQD